MDTLVGNGTMWATATFFPTVRCNKSQGMKQLMAGGGVALVGITLIPLRSGLFG